VSASQIDLSDCMLRAAKQERIYINKRMPPNLPQI